MSDDPYVLSPFAQLVVGLRKQRGMSQEALGKRAGVGSGLVSMIETGRRGRRPARDTVLRLAEGLRATDVEREELLRAAGWPVDDGLPSAPDVVQAINGDVRLRADQKRVLVDLYRTMVRV